MESNAPRETARAKSIAMRNMHRRDLGAKNGMTCAMPGMGTDGCQRATEQILRGARRPGDFPPNKAPERDGTSSESDPRAPTLERISAGFSVEPAMDEPLVLLLA